jgi:hypothetical protein
MNTVFYQVSHKCYNNQWGDLQSAKLLALLNQRCMVDIVMLLYMVLLQEFLQLYPIISYDIPIVPITPKKFIS